MLASALYAQGTNFDGQTKESWEEINFEFNSSILSDGYPSLLRLADLLGQHKDYRVKVTGNTDYVGSAAYNEKLALQRADAVKAFLIKYGASAEQISTVGEGKRVPEVDNASKEGRFMNRRVTLEVRDGQGRVVGDGRISDILPGLTGLQEAIKQNADCCAQILKRLDKLDDILAALNNLKGENDNLKTEIADLRNQQNALRDQVNSNKPLTEKQTADIANKAANDATAGILDEAAKRNQKFTALAINVGPNVGSAKGGDANFTAHGQFFSPFGGSGTSAVQAQGEYIFNSDYSSEGQFDIGLVHRMGPVQAGLFGSVKYLSLSQYHQGGALGQGAFMVDYVFKGGRFGVFGTQGFKNYAVLNDTLLYPGVYNQTYARIINQYGVSGLIGVWGDAYLQGNIGLLRRHIGGSNTAGGEIRLVQPITPHVAFTVEGDFNQALVATSTTGALAFGVQVGNYIKPREYAAIKTPVPMDVPRIRYELGTRRVGTAAPIADAGPNQINIPAQVVTLDGSGSYDPLGETLTYQWQQINGPTVPITNPTSAKASFTASAGNSYGFRLTVTNTDGLKGTASTMVSTQAAVQTAITQFIANPASIQPGQSSTLQWVTQNATTVSIAPGIGAVSTPGSGSVAVSPTSTTTYTLTATGPSGTVTQTAVVTVGAAPAGNPQILMWTATPSNIQPGQQSTLSWTTSGASTVTISGLGSVALNGSTTVSPATTTTYTLTATSSDGHSVTAPVTVTVTPVPVTPAGNPQILLWTANPMTIQPGQQSTLSWTTSGASTVTISGVGSVALNGSTTVSPTATTTYTLTATSSDGHSVTSPITVSVVPATVPQINAFTAVPSVITAGQSSKVCWQVTNATSIAITGIGSNLNANDCSTVSPSATTTYTLTATNPSGSTSGIVTISVGQLQILSFTATPAFSLASGSPVTLSWTTQGATSVVLVGGNLSALSNLSVNGSYTVNQVSDETYTLTAYGPGGQTVSTSIFVGVR
jgi:hypothetical protein